MARSMISPEAAAQKWQSRLASSGDAIRAGVAAVTTSPGQLAAAKKDLWLANVTASANRWADAVGKVTTQDWQAAMNEKGISRITQGAASGAKKMQSFLAAWMPFMQRTVQGLPARGGIDANIARMEQLVRAAHNAKGQYRQGGRSR